MVTIPSIHSVELSNFMCHSHLKLIFNKMITCIGGRNGSGATITATPSVYGTDICINNGIINYDDVYFHIIADADFTI